jgi:phosphoglycerate dehydrogenase-like enzyme
VQNNGKKILVNVYHLAEREAPYLQRLRDAGFDLVFNRLKRQQTADELIAALPNVFGTIAGGEPYTEPVFASPAARDLRIVARFGVGYDRVDVPAATRHGVAVAMAFGTNHEAVADGAFTLMAAIAGRVVMRDRQVRSGGWGDAFHQGLWRATVGVLGIGRIGRAFIRRCKGFEMRVIAHDPAGDPAWAKTNGVILMPLDQVLREADFLSLHAPWNKDTENLINAERLALMKKTAYLINTARGQLVDEDALYQALRAGKLAGAGIDCFRKEPPAGSPLLTLDNVILTPHSTGMDITAEHAMANRCIDSILACWRGESPGAEYVLNPEALRNTRH